jgi:predicted DNA-binding transcriptional regulator YafY
MRGESYGRQQRLLKLLETCGDISVQEVARDLGADPRTIYRDLHVLESNGTPLYQERRGRRARWRVHEGWSRRVTLSLSFLDLIALSAGARALDGQPYLREAASAALQRLGGKLPGDMSARVTRALELVAGPKFRVSQPSETGLVSRLTQALDTRETVRVRYRKLGARREQDYTVDPERLVVQAQGTYFVGWCHEREARRTFLLDRVRALTGTAKYFEPRADADADEIRHGIFGPWEGRAVRVRLRFARSAVPFLFPDRIHHTIQLQGRSDGGLDATLDVPGSPALVRWLVGWGSEVRVIAPAKLGDEVHRAHRQALNSE